MGSIRCSACGGSNVDYEGYCWSCEHQNDVGGTPPPPWLVASRDPFADLPPLPQNRSRADRLMGLLLPPILTFVVIVCGVGAFYSFRAADSFMSTPPQVVHPGGSVGTSGEAGLQPVAECVVGTWRLTSIKGTFTYSGLGRVPVEGSGGQITFDAGGRGSEIFEGRVVTGDRGGQRFTVTHSGTVAVSYSFRGGFMVIVRTPGQILATVDQGGHRWPITLSMAQSEVTVDCRTDSLTMAEGEGMVVSARAPR